MISSLCASVLIWKSQLRRILRCSSVFPTAPGILPLPLMDSEQVGQPFLDNLQGVWWAWLVSPVVLEFLKLRQMCNFQEQFLCCSKLRKTFCNFDQTKALLWYNSRINVWEVSLVFLAIIDDGNKAAGEHEGLAVASTPDWTASKSFCLERNQRNADR